MSARPPFRLTILAAVSAATMLAAGAGPAAAAGAPEPAQTLERPPYDPFEPVNRVMFKVDRLANNLVAGKGRIVTAPGWVPEPVRAGVYNVFQNLGEPATFANDLFQVKVAKAVNTSGRFAINSTVGVLGILDVAKKLGMERTSEDFGQTLGVYGVRNGPYIFLPFTGPSSLRDTAGGVVDGYFSPLGWVDMTTVKRKALSATRGVLRPQTLSIRQEARRAAQAGESRDEYAMLRELYFAQRQAQIHDEPNLADHPILMTPRKPKAAKPVS